MGLSEVFGKPFFTWKLIAKIGFDHILTTLFEKVWSGYFLQKKVWKKIKDNADKELFLNQTMRLEKATGFSSVWMEVFKDYKEVQQRLIAGFEGTQTAYFADILC